MGSAGGLALSSLEACGPPISSHGTGDEGSPHNLGATDLTLTHVSLAAYDYTGRTVDGLCAVLKSWFSTDRCVGSRGVISKSTHEPIELTVGFGPTLFRDTLGLTRFKPDELIPLPLSANDRIDTQDSGGDLVLVAKGMTPDAVAQIQQSFAESSGDELSQRWTQEGTRIPGTAPRNALGFHDGTANPKPGTPEFESSVVVRGDTGPSWLVGGSYLAVRRIEVDIEAWDRQSKPVQEAVIGRRKADGRLLDTPQSVEDGGYSPTAQRSHVGIAASAARGTKLVRRSFHFGRTSAGLDPGVLFLAYTCAPATAFSPVLVALARQDKLNIFLRHTASGVFAIPPSPPKYGDSYPGEGLFEKVAHHRF